MSSQYQLKCKRLVVGLSLHSLLRTSALVYMAEELSWVETPFELQVYYCAHFREQGIDWAASSLHVCKSTFPLVLKLLATS